MSGYWIQTLTHKCFDLGDPHPDQMDCETIAHVMAHTERFGAHADGYTLAEHSLHVHTLLALRSDEIRIAGLTHDVHEVYDGFGDVLRPAKELMPLHVREWYDGHVGRISAVVADKFGINPELYNDPLVTRSDLIALATERDHAMGGPFPREWGPLPNPDIKLPRLPKQVAKEKLFRLLTHYERTAGQRKLVDIGG